MAGTWSSLLVEMLRFGEDQGFLQKGARYLVARGGERAAEYTMELGNDDFLDLLDRLRYVKGSEAERAEARATVAGVVTRMLQLPLAAGDLQIDLVLSAKELAALPVEAVNGPDGQPFVLRRTPAVEITRRVRGAFRSRAAGWPAKPRILFAAAAPTKEVPAGQHARALRNALRPWLEPLAGVPDATPDEGEFLTILPRASLGAIRDACAERKGFTHVHILAHGCAIGDGMRQRYGLELHPVAGGTIAQVSAEALLDALAGGGTLPTVVTISACDSANVGSTITSSASLAHALHAAGVPVVLGSQFPLTVPGSVLAVERFYGALLRPPSLDRESPRGTDVRDAIHEARLALYDGWPDTGHDWMSLAAYVQLPEGYDDRLVEVGLETELAALRTAQRWADRLTTRVDGGAEQCERVAERLRERIESLLRWAKLAADTGRPDVIQENRGLLGSAHKRLAEVLECRARLGGDRERWGAESRNALEEARRWYELGFKENQSAHWLGVQHLSLEAVLRGSIAQPWQWQAVLGAARTACESAKECWAAGTRAELHLLAPCAGQQPQLGEAVAALRDLEKRVGGGDRFPLESTARQLARYASWWTSAGGFFPGAKDLANEVRGVMEEAGCGKWTT